jgi:colicin import membrane protein
MKDQPRAHAYLFHGSDAERRTWYKFFAISLLLHVTLFAAVLFMPDFSSQSRPYAPAVMNVHMVTLKAESSGPAGPPASKPAQKEPPPPAKKPKKKKKVHVPAKEPVAEVRPQPKAKPEISLAPKKIKPKTSLKKKTYKPEKVVKSAIRKLEKETQNTTSQKIESALARLKQKVHRQGPPQASKQPSAGTGGGGYGGAPGGMSARALSQLDIYKTEVAYQIQKHWAFSEQLAGNNRKLEAVLVIKILPSGEIADIWFEKRSGNKYLDDSAYKAIQKANPLPRLPEGYLRPFYNLAVRFTPKGLR